MILPRYCRVGRWKFCQLLVPRPVKVRSLHIQECHHQHSTDTRSGIEPKGLRSRIPSVNLQESSQSGQIGQNISGEFNEIRTNLELAGYSKNENKKSSSADNRSVPSEANHTYITRRSSNPSYIRDSRVGKPPNDYLSLKPQETRKIVDNTSFIDKFPHPKPWGQVVVPVKQSSSINGVENLPTRNTNFRPDFNTSRTNSHSDRHTPLSHRNTSTINITSTPQVSHLEYFQYADTLKTMIFEGSSLNRIWIYIIKHLCPNFPQDSSPTILQPFLSNVLELTVESKRKNPLDSSLPSITTISEILCQRNFLNKREWADLVIVLLENISLICGRLIDDKYLISDIVGAWNVASNNRSFCKSITSEVAKRHYQEHGLESVFGLITPTLSDGDVTNVSLAAIAMFGILTNNPPPAHDRTPEAVSLIESLACVISIPDLEIRSLESTNKSAALSSFVYKNWNEIRDRACQILDSKRELEKNLTIHEISPVDKTESTELSTFPQPRIRGLNPIYHRLRSAVNLKNHALVDELWSEVKKWPTSNPEIDTAQSNWNGNLSAEVCDQFVSAYMRLQRPIDAISVWDNMKERGFNPTFKTWNHMMLGCKAVNDWKSSEKIWKMMLHAGLIPDTINWSSRLNVLMDSKEIEMGIQVLDEMGRQWVEKATKKYPNIGIDDLLLKDDVEGVAKPDISCLNIALSGLLRQGRRSTANKIVEWGRKFGIKPDTATYNTFLRFFVRNGNNQEATSLLRRMGKAEVEADVITFTIILDQVLRFPGQYSSEDLKDIIEGIFDDIEKANIRPNLSIYGKIIHQLVRDRDRNNMPSVEAVLQRMTNQGLQPSVHIYTNLIEYSLLQTPPGLDLAQKIINKAIKVAGLDRVFWDRTIECYAQIGETKIALHILGELSTEKIRVGWSALRRVLNALYAQKEWHLAKSFVRDIQTSACNDNYRTGTQGEALFWELAARLDGIDF